MSKDQRGYCQDCGGPLKGHGKPVRCHACKVAYEKAHPEIAIKRGRAKFNLACPANAGERNHNWKGGGIDYRGDGWTRARRLTLERDGYKCVKCGRSDGKIDVDHIKGKEETGGIWDNSLENLQTLCTSCHAKKTGIGGRIDCNVVCRMCGKEFVGHAGNASLCSVECRRARWREKNRAKTK